MTTISVCAADHVCRQPFLVLKTLNAEAIRGTTYIDNQVEAIQSRRKRGVVRNVSIVKILKRNATAPMTERIGEFNTRAQIATPKIRLTRRTVLAPHS